MFIPEQFLHATVNLEEGVAAAVQCDNTDPRTNLTALNALVVHASEEAHAALGPCGVSSAESQNLALLEIANDFCWIGLL